MRFKALNSGKDDNISQAPIMTPSEHILKSGVTITPLPS